MKKNLQIKLQSNRDIGQFDSALIMGILNYTPDSFSDKGAYFNTKSALKRAEQMIAEGAKIIDLGAESTRPNSERISAEEEMRRLKEILPQLRSEFPKVAISIDTYKVQVAQYCIDSGADIINDVFGGAFDESLDESKMYKFCAKAKCPIIITHNKKAQSIDEIISDINLSINMAIECGIEKNQIIVDYGFGFNKDAVTNLKMQKELEKFKKLNLPLLLGVSRKSTLKGIVGSDINNLDIATAIFFADALSKNAVDIFRTHNVAYCKLCLDCINNIQENL